MCSEDPAWKRLISHPLTTYERISLIAAIFSDKNPAKVVGHLLGDDIQAFIDTIDEVSFCTVPCSKIKAVNLHICQSGVG